MASSFLVNAYKGSFQPITYHVRLNWSVTHILIIKRGEDAYSIKICCWRSLHLKTII